MDLTTRRTDLSADASTSLIAHAQDAAVRAGLRCTVAILDTGGNVKALLRMDGASLTSSQVAIDKAYTALSGRPTHLWQASVESDEVLRASARHQIARLVTLGGGYPIVIDDAVVGGLGISGGHYTQDMDVAVDALVRLGAKSDW